MPAESTSAAIKKWKKASCDAVSFISRKMDPSIFIEVVDNETMEDAHLLWEKINEQYASKAAINRGRVVMNWVSIAYKGNFEEFIKKCQQSLVDIASVNIKIPPDVLSYMILGKPCDHTSMYHLADSLAMSAKATENPSNTFNQLQNYARHLESKHKVTKDKQSSTALISSSNHPTCLVYYCANGVHNGLNTSHKPNQFYVEFPHLRPKRKKDKDNQSSSSPSTHLSTAHALMTFTPKSLCEIIIDSAVTHHMFNDKSLFTSLELCPPFVISTGNPASNLCSEGKGSIPCISHNLISMIQLLEESITIEKLTEERFKMIINCETTLYGQIINGLMSVTHNAPKTLISVNQPLECVHIDLVGPITPESNSGFQYFLTIVDQFTSFKLVRFLKNKNKTFKEFVEWKTFAENFHSLKIKKLVSDKGGEFENKIFSTLATSCSFVHLFGPTFTPEHNGFAKRANCTILDKARCLLLTSSLPRSYWAEAVSTASFLSNLAPTPSRDNLSPYSMWSSNPVVLKD
ncbi:hypothetical protein O181_091990 [Austropuccinia psidii MF-1]|uniref:Integrase catalytic domain-containing protein n=1 Tax=Austropuccinia psidii MF-1 TaxID=1389203 RepID=A0A9Q3P8N3_9BASI|nr:hypothetical protein [Austropuccinia psidii MF-1]